VQIKINRVTVILRWHRKSALKYDQMRHPRQRHRVRRCLRHGEDNAIASQASDSDINELTACGRKNPFKLQ
jgi:hypothetical protein